MNPQIRCHIRYHTEGRSEVSFFDRFRRRKPRLTPEQIDQAVQAFINAGDWAESKRIVEAQRDLLLTDVADWCFAALLKQYELKGDAETIRVLEEHRALLARCRREGIDAAFADRLRQARPRPAQPRPAQPRPAQSPRAPSSAGVKVHPPGTRIGQYEIAGRPMMGGMGIVYVCFDHQENRPVALKTFKPEYLPNRAARDRFLREGTAWVDLGRHSHIVRCYNVLYVDPAVYLVLELVAKEQGYPNASLRPWLIPGRPLPVEQALLFALQIARGMKHAVATIPGFVHRDLKPENVLVGADKLSNANLPGAGVNRLRVTDFGLASALQAIQTSKVSETLKVSVGRTQLTHGVVGTPLYMAPEQWRGERVTAATDIYALGCILYEMLAGQHTVAGHSLAALRRVHCAGDLRPLPSNLSEPVRALLVRCLALEPGERYGGWAEVEAAMGTAFQAVTGRAAPPAKPVTALSRAERVQAGWSYNAMGISYLDIGKVEVAMGYFEQAREVGESEGERQLAGAVLGNLGSACLNLGDARRAIGYFEQALEIAREIGDRHGEGAALGNLGNAYKNLGDARRAIGYFEQHLAIAREIGDRRGEGAALGNLGNAYARLGDARRAIGYYEQALEIARETGDRHRKGTALNNLGEVYRNLGDARRAIGYYEQHLTIAREIGGRRGEGNALGNLGAAYDDLGDIRRAIGYYEQALTILREIGDRHGEGTFLGNLGVAYEKLGDARRAIGYYEQHLTIAREIGDRHGEGNALGNLGIAYKGLGKARRAIGFHEQDLAIAREIGDRAGEGGALGNLGNAYADLGEARRAIGFYEQCLTIAREIGNRAGEGATLGNLGVAYADLGDARRAIGFYEQHLAIAREIGDRQGEALGCWNLGLLYEQQGNLARAVELMQVHVDFEREIGHPDAEKDAARVAQIRGQRR